MNAIPLIVLLLFAVPPMMVLMALLWCDASSRGYWMYPDEPAPLISEIEAVPNKKDV